ncbi:MAG: response regulator [Alphaproteobacteria bacterium]
MARILLAEDDEALRTFLGNALRRAGHVVTAVADGSAALAEIKERQFDLLIADIVMPRIDGIELSRRAAREHPELKVLFITGFAAVAMTARRTFTDARVLSKPFHLRELVDNVHRILAA